MGYLNVKYVYVAAGIIVGIENAKIKHSQDKTKCSKYTKRCTGDQTKANQSLTIMAHLSEQL